MAPLKFRAWRDGKMIADIQTTYDDDRGCSFYTFVGNPDCVVTQSTGLFDKNGKEIFEADVCKYWMDGVWKVGNVFWCRGGWALQVTKMGENEVNVIFEFQSFIPTPHKGTQMHDEFEVIGNIYENPDLLPKAA